MNIRTQVVLVVAAFLALTCPAFAQRGYVRHDLQILSEHNRPITDITSITICTSATTDAQTIYTGELLSSEITNPITTTSTNTTLNQSNGTCYWYGVDAYDATIVSTTYGTMHVKGYSAATSTIIFPTYWQASQEQSFEDNQYAAFGTDEDWVLGAGATANLFTATPASSGDDAQWWFGNGTYTSDVYFHGATADYNCVWDASENTLELWDNVTLAIGTGDDYTISHNGTTTTVAGNHTFSGIPTFSTDVLFDGTYDIAYDDNRYQLLFEDNAVLGLGGAHDAAGDITLSYDGTDLLMEAAAADDLWKIGYTTNFDVAVYGDTNTDLAYFDTSAELLYFDGFDVRFNDGDFLKFGDDSDWTIDSSTTKILDIVPLTTDETSAVYIGADEAGADLKVFGTTSGDALEWDASADYLHMVGDLALFTMAEAGANQFKVDATGTVAGNAIVLETTNGGIQILADGASNGDIAIDCEDDMTLTAAGDLTLAVTGTISAGGSAITNQIVTVETDIDNEVLTADESGKYFNNNGDTNTTVFTLPTAAAGLIFTFTDVEAGGGIDLCILANTGDKIDNGTAAQYLNCYDDTYGSSVTLVAIDATEWVVVAERGTWTADSNTTQGD